MQLTAVLLLLSLGSWLVGGQQDQQIEIDEETRKRIDEVFSTGGNNEFLPGYEEVVSSNNDSYGALENCGEGSTKNVKRCVNYSMCDGKTNTIVQQGVTDGFGIIDIRFGANACSHYMDVCCKIPEGGLDPNLPLPGDDDNLEPRLPDDTSQGTSQNPITPDIVTPEPVTTPPIVKPSFCGIRNPDGIDFKITGNRNHEAEYGEFPWMVAILNKNYLVQGLQKPLICGGSLITPNVVLTGAHCVHNSKTFDLVIRAGEWDTQTTKERLPYQERNVKTIIVHEDFIYGNLFNDVALLILDESIRKADNVGTICLPSQATRINSRNCFVSGWGKDEFGKQGKFQAILKKIELPTIDRRRCQDALRTTRLGQSFALHSSFMCAGGEKGKDACTGDGGSPLVCPDPQNPERYVQAGIVAWGIGCGELNIPGVYADVSKFRSWVDQKLRRLNIGDAPYTV